MNLEELNLEELTVKEMHTIDGGGFWKDLADGYSAGCQGKFPESFSKESWIYGVAWGIGNGHKRSVES